MKTLINFCLVVVGLALSGCLTLLGLSYGLIVSSLRWELSKYLLRIAVSIDQTGNVTCKYLLDLLLIQKISHKFGNPDETISSVIGKNYVSGTLTDFGYIIHEILCWFENDHCIKSIEEDESYDTKRQRS